MRQVESDDDVLLEKCMKIDARGFGYLCFTFEGAILSLCFGLVVYFIVLICVYNDKCIHNVKHIYIDSVNLC